MTQPTTATSAGGAPTAGRPSLGRPSSLLAWLRSALFRRTAAGPIGWRKILAGVAFVLIGAAVSLARTRGPGALNTTWIEDAGNFLNNALRLPATTTLTTQLNGYYNMVPRALTAVAVLFPLRWAPAVMSIFAALQYSLFGLIAYVASGPHLRSPWLRLLIAVPVCMVPLGYTQVNNDLATVQFLALYAMFWLLLWLPGTRAGRVVAPVIILGITLSSILPVLFAPLALARLIADRSKSGLCLIGCYLLGLAVQFSVGLRGLSNRPSSWYTSPWWVLRKYASEALPRAIFGEHALGGAGTNADGMPVPLHITSATGHHVLIGLAWLIVVAVIVIALTRLTDPHWPLAVAAALFSVIIFLGEIVDNLTIVQPRYVIAPALLLYTAIVALLRPRGVMQVAAAGDPSPVHQSPVHQSPVPPSPVRQKPVHQKPARPVLARLSWLPVTAFAVVLAVSCGLNFRVTNGRSQSPAWSSVVAQAQASCAKPGVTSYLYLHIWWAVRIPCDRLPHR